MQIVGIPDEKYGEVVGAFIVRRDGADITEADVVDFTRSRIAPYKKPKHVFFVDSYPMTASGKIQKYKLREMACVQLGITGTVFAKEEEE